MNGFSLPIAAMLRLVLGLSAAKLALANPFSVEEALDLKSIQPNYSVAEAYPEFAMKLQSRLSLDMDDYPSNLKDYILLAESLVKHKTPDDANQDRLSEAAQLFSKLSAPGKCGLTSYKILMGNYRSAVQNSETFREIDSDVNVMVATAIENHAHLCQQHYLDRFERRSKTLDGGVRKRIRRTLNTDTLGEIFTGKSLRGRIREVGLWDRLNELGAFKLRAQQRSQAIEVSGAELNQLMEPCETFYNQFASIFLPARLDMVLNDDNLELIADPQQDVEFCEDWLRFRVCSALLRDRVLFEQIDDHEGDQSGSPLGCLDGLLCGLRQMVAA